MKLISKRSAIMALTKHMSDWNDDRNKIVGQCIGAIRGLKVHDSKERKTGKWKRGGYCCGETEWICPKCNASEWRTNRVPFCPWCGNPMEVEE